MASSCVAQPRAQIQRRVVLSSPPTRPAALHRGTFLRPTGATRQGAGQARRTPHAARPACRSPRGPRGLSLHGSHPLPPPSPSRPSSFAFTFVVAFALRTHARPRAQQEHAHTSRSALLERRTSFARSPPPLPCTQSARTRCGLRQHPHARLSSRLATRRARYTPLGSLTNQPRSSAAQNTCTHTYTHARAHIHSGLVSQQLIYKYPVSPAIQTAVHATAPVSRSPFRLPSFRVPKFPSSPRVRGAAAAAAAHASGRAVCRLLQRQRHGPRFAARASEARERPRGFDPNLRPWESFVHGRGWERGKGSELSACGRGEMCRALNLAASG